MQKSRTEMLAALEELLKLMPPADVEKLRAQLHQMENERLAMLLGVMGAIYKRIQVEQGKA